MTARPCGIVLFARRSLPTPRAGDPYNPERSETPGRNSEAFLLGQLSHSGGESGWPPDTARPACRIRTDRSRRETAGCRVQCAAATRASRLLRKKARRRSGLASGILVFFFLFSFFERFTQIEGAGWVDEGRYQRDTISAFREDLVSVLGHEDRARPLRIIAGGY